MKMRNDFEVALAKSVIKMYLITHAFNIVHVVHIHVFKTI